MYVGLINGSLKKESERLCTGWAATVASDGTLNCIIL